MQLSDLQKINKGTTGANAAQIIYENDRKLYNAIKECEDSIQIRITNVTGDSTTMVMSQAAVTSELDNINQRLNDGSYISSSAETASFLNYTKFRTEIIEGESHTVADRAAADLKGRSISMKIDEFNTYKNTVNAAILSLTARIVALENQINN